MVHLEYEVMNTNKKYRDITYYTIISKKMLNFAYSLSADCQHRVARR